ncbi:Cytochrome p450, partial [Thalictrum thalictroides]
MADKYGPVFMVRLGVHRALVVSSSEISKECYTTNDKAFGSRPDSTAAKIMGYNYGMFGLAPYGPYWRKLRKLIMTELLSSRRLGLLKHVRDSEIDTSIKELYIVWVNNNKGADGSATVEIKHWFGDLTLNVILRMIAGKRYFGTTSDCNENDSKRCHKAMRDFMRLLMIFIAEDAIPYLKWFDLQGYKKEMKNTAKEFDSLCQGWLEEHQRKKHSGEIQGEQDFMDVLMSMLEQTKISDVYDNDTIIKATCLSIIVGGGDTTMFTLTWILSLLLNNKQVLKKAQEELDNHVGRDRQVKESDLKDLVYLHAIIKEGLRLYPPGPLSGPRMSSEDCTVAGYHVPA